MTELLMTYWRKPTSIIRISITIAAGEEIPCMRQCTITRNGDVVVVVAVTTHQDAIQLPTTTI